MPESFTYSHPELISTRSVSVRKVAAQNPDTITGKQIIVQFAELVF